VAIVRVVALVLHALVLRALALHALVLRVIVLSLLFMRVCDASASPRAA
jgi:hypothetical protein